MYKIGDTIIHKTLGKGEIIFTETMTDNLGREHFYFDVHFENDPKYKVRQFSSESIVPFLVEHIPGTNVEED